MRVDGARAATVLDGYFVNSICVYDEEGGVAWDGAFAIHAGMVELDFQPKGLEGNFDEF